MKKENDKNNLKKISGILIVLCISTFLWLIIKLSDEYVITLPFNIKFVEQPANQTLPESQNSIEAVLTTTGFHLLNYYITPKKSREIEISLKEIKYKKIDEDIYSIGAMPIKELIANFMEINENDVSIKEDDIVFRMYKRASKRVKVVPQVNITFESQFNMYGEPTVSPDSITINGAYNTIKDIFFVNTNTINMKNVRTNISKRVGLQLDDDVYPDVDEVDVSIDVEKFTESAVTIPINTLKINNLHLFPAGVKIRYIVAMKDYSNISNMSFDVEIDTTNFKNKERLPLRLVVSPNNTKVIGISPSEVEYIMIN